jgi:hypothetical protein
MTIRPSFACAAVLVVAITSACDVRVNDKGVSLDVNEGGRAEDTWSRTYTVSKGGRFELEAAFGRIEVLPSTGSAIEVEAARSVRARSDEAAKNLLTSIDMKEEVLPDRVRLQAWIPEGRGQFRSLNVEYQIKIPPGLNVFIKSEFGNVNLNRVAGRFDVSVTNGRISGEAVSGALQAQTVNGQVIMEMADVTDDIRITTVNGAVMLGLPADANATIEASAINGSVIVFESLPVNARTKERQRLSGRLGTGSGPRIELQATNGNVRLGGGKPPS